MDANSVCVQRSLSVLDRLLLTHSIWLQLSVTADSALNILQREPIGTFLVCKCVSSQKKVLCVRLSADNSTSAVKQHRIREEESTFALEGSALSFPDLCRLVAFYCVSRDVLPFPLELPETIAQASSHTQLEAISHLGSEFWSSQHASSSSSNSSSSSSSFTPPNGPPAAGRTSLAPPPRPTPCFINPLFLHPPEPPQERAASSKRHRFRRSLRVRVSTETSLSLSSGAESGAGSAGGSAGGGIGGGGGGQDQRQQQTNHTLYRRGGTGGGMLKRSPALSPTSEEEDDIMAQQASQDTASGEVSVEQLQGCSCSMEEACLSLQTARAPSLAALDSNSSFSSLEEDDDDYEGESFSRPGPASSSSTSSMSSTSAHSQRPSLKRMSAAFVCLFAPERRVARLVLQLSRDPRSAFGALVQDFLCAKRAELTALQGAVADGGGSTAGGGGGGGGGGGDAAEALQGLRKFLTQAKGFLLGSGELEPPIETLVPENEKDLALEKAMFGCILKPLRVVLDKALQASAGRDGSLTRLSEGMRACQEGCPRQRLGVAAGVGLLDGAGVARARRKLALMARTHSPIDKVLLLLQVCKRVYQSLGTQPGQDVMSEHFLPALAYVLVYCNMPHLLLEVQYMMELLEPSWLTGEGGYYLTSAYASLCLIESQPQAPPVGGMTSEAQEKLGEWSRRRGQERYTHLSPNHNQRLVRVLYQEGSQSVVRTLQWADGEPASSLALSCATAFAVSQPHCYGLFCRAAGGEMKPLPPHALIHEAHAHSDVGLPSLSYLRVDHDTGKVRRLTRGGAMDLGGSVCEE
ncbi:hypothetical protein ACEWY4_024965 [Coilia grayii]|uniref:Uncharacterized protein n=1 Tax=Coilia grayii TaxID=363190 RepID=A0ABD1IZA5_9TELE